MMSNDKHSGFVATPLAVVGLILLLAGCQGAANVRSSGESFYNKALAPGDTVLCRDSPCRVQFQIPDGSGEVEIMAGTMSMGAFPAGTTADLGDFYHGQTFTLKGRDAPPAYLSVGF